MILFPTVPVLFWFKLEKFGLVRNWEVFDLEIWDTRASVFGYEDFKSGSTDPCKYGDY